MPKVRSNMKQSMKYGAKASAMRNLATSRGSASKGVLLRPGSKKSVGRLYVWKRPSCYIGKRAGQGGARRLAHHDKASRIAFRDLAALSAPDRVRVGFKLGYMRSPEGKKCPHGCKGKLKLVERGENSGESAALAHLDMSFVTPQTLCLYVCSEWTCNGMKTSIAVVEKGPPRRAVPLGK